MTKLDYIIIILLAFVVMHVIVTDVWLYTVLDNLTKSGIGGGDF